MSDGSNGFAQTAVDDLVMPIEGVLPQPPEYADDLEEEQRKSIFEKFRFSWRPEDKAILVRIENAVDEEFGKNFASAIRIFERFFGAMHIPDTITGANGQQQLLLDNQRRQVYKRDGKGDLIEDYGQLTGQDFEEAILNLERLRLNISPRISQLLSDAVYAKLTAGDFHDDTYWHTADGTIADRTARANRESRPDRYHAFIRYRLWMTCKDFYDEIGRFQAYLEKIRTWKSFER